MEQLLEHICYEDEIEIFHQWISEELCNPDSRIVQSSSEKFKTITDNEQSMQKMRYLL